MEATVETNKCKYCEKEFRRATSLSAHVCEPKRRWQQENDTGVRLGFQAYVRFYELTQGTSKKSKGYAEFVSSPYYSSFVKFGQYIVSVRAVNPTAFINWIIKSNKKLDTWTKDANYDEYLLSYLRTEHTQDALERAMTEMDRWATENNSTLDHFFVHGNPNKVCQLINNGRVSPWIVFCCDSGTAFLGSLNEAQIQMIYVLIEPVYWQRKFDAYPEDHKWVKEVLKVAGL